MESGEEGDMYSRAIAYCMYTRVFMLVFICVRMYTYVCMRVYACVCACARMSVYKRVMSCVPNSIIPYIIMNNTERV